MHRSLPFVLSACLVSICLHAPVAHATQTPGKGSSVIVRAMKRVFDVEGRRARKEFKVWVKANPRLREHYKQASGEAKIYRVSGGMAVVAIGMASWIIAVQGANPLGVPLLSVPAAMFHKVTFGEARAIEDEARTSTVDLARSQIIGVPSKVQSQYGRY